MRMRYLAIVGVLAVAGIAATLGAVGASEESAGIIKYRQAVMSAQGGHMSALARVVQGEADFAADIPAHARALSDLSTMVIPTFPEGSLEGAETDALPVIWEDWDDFTVAADALETASEDLVAAAEGGDMTAIAAAFGEVGRTCRSCHDTFRAE